MNVFAGVGEGHVVLVGVAVDDACLELDKLSVEVVVYTSCETRKVWTCTFYGTFLLEVVEGNVVSIIFAAAAEVDVVVLADACFEDFVEPVGVGVVHELVGAVILKDVARWERRVGVCASLADVIGILFGVHNFVNIVGHNVHTYVARIINLHWRVFSATFCSDDDDAVSSTRAVDCACRGVFENLDGLDVVWREVTDCGTHRHTVNDVERRRIVERADTADADRRVGARLAV